MLAGVAAHDFINILKRVQGYRNLMLSEMHSDYPLSHQELPLQDNKSEKVQT